MTVELCPVCHGLPDPDKSAWTHKGQLYQNLRSAGVEKSTFVLINVLGAVRKEHWRCNNCGYTESRDY